MWFIFCVLFLVGCFYLGRFIFFDMWFLDKKEKPYYNPELEEYIDFKKELNKSLQNQDIKQV